MGWHVDSFSAVTVPRKVTYEVLREAVLEAGRFSAFEATDTQHLAKLYTKLACDPTLLLDKTTPFPWTNVRLRSSDDPPHEMPIWATDFRGEWTCVSCSVFWKSKRAERCPKCGNSASVMSLNTGAMPFKKKGRRVVLMNRKESGDGEVE